MASTAAEPRPWEQQRDESGPAYEAFLTYCGQGAARSFVATARARGRQESLMRRWATRHQWRERAWRWDLHQARQQEAVVREHRESALKERLEDVDRVARACLAFFRTLVRRDPATGEVSFDARFTPAVALRFLEVALRAQGAFEKPAAEDPAEGRPATDLFGLADGELEALIETVKGRVDLPPSPQEQSNETEQREEP